MAFTDVITMTMRELDRSKVIQMVVDGMLKPWRAALRLDLTTRQVRRLAARLREPEPVVRFETPPGKQMQADFTHIRRGRDPLIAFVATLGYSRMTWVRFTRDERAETLRFCIAEAFKYFDGVPQHVLLDNASTIVIERDAGGSVLLCWSQQRGAGQHLPDRCHQSGFSPRALVVISEFLRLQNVHPVLFSRMHLVFSSLQVAHFQDRESEVVRVFLAR